MARAQSRTPAPKLTNFQMNRWHAAALAILALGACNANAEKFVAPSDDWPLVVKAHDTLIGIAHRYLDNPGDWKRLEQHNHVSDPYHLRPGSTLLIPFVWMRTEASTATVVGFSGVAAVRRDAQAQSVPTQVGAVLGEANVVETDDQGTVTLRLADGSMVRVLGDSAIRLDRLRRLSAAQRIDAVIGVDHGRVEAAGKHQLGGRFEVVTPLAIAGVRGTVFGVEYAASAGMLSEVLEGAVEVNGANTKAPRVTVDAGEGTHVGTSGTPDAPVKLLVAPLISSNQLVQDRPVVRFDLGPAPGAVAYQAEIARDADFVEIVAQVRTATTTIKVDGLPDGHYFLRVRAIDSNGLHGLPALVSFALKARPEPPFGQAPANHGKVRSDATEAQWTEVPGALRYRVQLASGSDFSHPLVDQTVDATHVSLAVPTLGEYSWRISTVGASASGAPDVGPFGDAMSFTRLAAQRAADPEIGNDGSVQLSWSAEAGQTFHIQIAADASFAKPLVDQTTTEAHLKLAALPAGIYFVRVRATDADGFIGSYTAARKFVIESLLRTTDGAPVGSGFGKVSTGP
jgi:hypothetical protein